MLLWLLWLLAYLAAGLMFVVGVVLLTIYLYELLAFPWHGRGGQERRPNVPPPPPPPLPPRR